MTTPRDDIAGLSERLRERIHLLGQSPDSILKFMDRILPLIEEAATQLDSLLKEREALQARVKELESGIAHAQYRSDNCDAENQSLYNRLEAVESRATRLQQEREIAQFGFEHELQIKKELADALRKAQQERDEAHERLKPFVDVAEEMLSRGWDASNVALALDNPNEPHRVTAGDFFAIRRLAGPEKEKKE